MASTKLYLDLRGKAKDNNGSIVIVISHNRTTTTVATGIRVSRNEWDGKKVIRRSDASILNAELAKKKNDVDTKIALLQLDTYQFASMTAPEIKASFDKPKRSKGHRISTMFDEYLSQPFSHGTVGLYRATLKKILNLYGDVVIESLSYRWLVEFDKYLSKTRGVNGKAIDLRNLRAVCYYTERLFPEYTSPFHQFKIRTEPTMKRCIPIEKLREFYHFECTSRQAMFRDYFFLMFFLIGINAADLFLATKDQIVKGRFEYIRKKTHKKYSIKLEPETEELLSRYAGKDYLVEAMDHCKDYHNFLHEMNDALGMIGPTVKAEEYVSDDLFAPVKYTEKVEPIIPDITSYYARHTWATLAYELNTPIDTISQALGHSFGNKTTWIYVREDQSKVDAANRKVIDYLLG